MAIRQITDEIHFVSEIGSHSGAYILATCSSQPTSGRMYRVHVRYFSIIIFFLATVLLLSSQLLNAATTEAVEVSDEKKQVSNPPTRVSKSGVREYEREANPYGVILSI